MSRAPKLATADATATLVEEDVDINSLVDNPRNPNTHPDDQITRLMASLTARGQYRPVLARKANRMLIAGHGVRAAARRLGWTEIRVALWDIDQQTADAVMLGDNRLAELSIRDEDRISELLREMPEGDWLTVGFSDEETARLLNELLGDEIVVHEIDTSTVADTFWINVTGPLAMQAVALKRLKEVMVELPMVVVELGTVAGD